jgi:glycosyltransferase involved in cell wall biosynthesis
MKIFFDDGARIYRNSGYGNLARSLAQSLARIKGVHLYIHKPISADPGIDLTNLLAYDNVRIFNEQPIDFIFRVATPSLSNRKGEKVILYTQNALGGLREDWKEVIKQVDGVIVPGEFDRKVFQAVNPLAYTCPQTIDNASFIHQPSFRSEGHNDFSFLFVGSFSYRKGVDLLLKGLSAVFSNTQKKACLHMICPTGLGQSEYNLSYLIEMCRQAPDNLTITCDSRLLTTAWMRRNYNRVDAIITMSRGEGWCMPLYEALLCEKPVIAPNSTAMKEFLPSTGVIKLPVTTKLVSAVEDDFGTSFKLAYGDGDITYDEPSETSLSDAVTDIMSAHRHYCQGAKVARQKILNVYNIENNSQRLEKILQSWVKTF